VYAMFEIIKDVSGQFRGPCLDSVYIDPSHFALLFK
jgi:hypothetical protein